MSSKLALLYLLCLLGILVLAGCGYNGKATPTTVGSSRTITATTPEATVAATVRPANTPGSSSGKVSLQLSASGYQANQAIEVTITNGTGRPIWFADHQSNCTIVQLERQNGSSWQPVGECRLMTPTRFLSLDAGKSEKVSLAAPTTLWPKGTYRVSFSYGVGPGETSAPTITLYSPLFQVN